MKSKKKTKKKSTTKAPTLHPSLRFCLQKLKRLHGEESGWTLFHFDSNTRFFSNRKEKGTFKAITRINAPLDLIKETILDHEKRNEFDMNLDLVRCIETRSKGTTRQIYLSYGGSTYTFSYSRDFCLLQSSVQSSEDECFIPQASITDVFCPERKGIVRCEVECCGYVLNKLNSNTTTVTYFENINYKGVNSSLLAWFPDYFFFYLHVEHLKHISCLRCFIEDSKPPYQILQSKKIVPTKETPTKVTESIDNKLESTNEDVEVLESTPQPEYSDSTEAHEESKEFNDDDEEDEESEEEEISPEKKYYLDKVKELYSKFLKHTSSQLGENGWEKSSVSQGVEIWTNNTIENYTTVLGRGIVDAPALVIKDFIREVENKSYYDQLLKDATVLETINDKVRVHLERFHAQFPTKARDCVLLGSWRKVEDEFHLFAGSTDHELAPPNKNFVRVDVNIGGWVLRPCEDRKKTFVIYLSSCNLGGSIPKFILDRVSKSQPLSIANIAKYMSKKDFSNYQEEDDDESEDEVLSKNKPNGKKQIVSESGSEKKQDVVKNDKQVR